MSSNINNLANPTNFICGSGDLDLTQIYCTSVTLPGINLNNPFLTTSAGSALNLGGDNIMFNTIQLSLLIDEDYEIYFEFLTKLQNSISSTNSTFANIEFDFFIDINNSKGVHIFKVNLINARLQAIGDVELETSSEETQMVLPIELVFDYIEYTKSGTTLTLRV